MTICLSVFEFVQAPVGLEQFTNIQRGIIFIWLLFSFFLFIITGVRLVAGSIDSEDNKYKQKEGGTGAQNQSESQQHFDEAVIVNQKVVQDDPGSVKFGKIVSKFQTLILPLSITFALNLTLGVNWSFSFVLFFLVLVPMILFNVLSIHKKMCSHKVFIAIADNFWILMSFFWLLNIWTTGRYLQPYYISYTDQSTCSL